MFCMIDNYDSFTYNLVHYIQMQGEDVEVFRNDHDLKDIDLSGYTGVILSPGPSTPQNSGITLDVIKKTDSVPILGVCLGMQSIAYVFGGTVSHAKRTMHGKVDTIEHYGGDLFEGIPSTFKAVRYHSLAVSKGDLPSCLEIRAHASDGEMMAFVHKSRYIWGVQFHPESYLTEYGHKLMENFIGGCYEYKKHN